MAKNEDVLSKIGGMYIIYILRWVILIGIIIIVVVIFSVKGELDNEYQQYGYTGFSDKIHYDEFTDEVIPKGEIENYNNDNKYVFLITSKIRGDNITIRTTNSEIKLSKAQH